MLWPIKVDASANDGSVRLVDTLIIDSTSLPIPPARPPSSASTAADRKTLLHETVETNAAYLAATLISDMECFGITRINKTYIGRVRLWDASPGLYEQVLGQITDQLDRLLTSEWNVETVVFKQTQLEETHSEIRKDDTNNGLVHIKLRLRESKVYIVDDFFLDPKLSSSNPFIIASGIAQDLNLRPEHVNSIAITILEQMHGLQVEENLSGFPTPTSSGTSQPPIMTAVSAGMTSAWMIRNKDENVARDVLLEQHRIK